MQRYIIRRVAEGWRLKEIAADLPRSIATVVYHLTRAKRLLGIKGKARLTQFSAAQGWVDL